MVLGRIGGITTENHLTKWRFVVRAAMLGACCLVLGACGGGSNSSSCGGGSSGSKTANAGLEFTWASGSDTNGAKGVYGTLGTPAAGNVPGARADAVSWTDASGNLWLFGGDGYDSVGSISVLDDLWEFSSSSGQWTWVSGFDTGGAKGVYGTRGTPATNNIPGARDGAVSWIDASGNLWLFGGIGYDSTGTMGYLNDLWEYSPSSGQWTWVSGSDTVNASGVYGTQGTPSVSNIPGARTGAISWRDASGNLWLFGGEYGYASEFNDLWEYSPSSGQWTWVSGSDAVNASGVYGTRSTAAASNVPGARYNAVSWVDASGNLWLFGGGGYDSTGQNGGLNDLWEFSPSSGQWTWMSGSDTVGASGVYGTLGTPAAGNTPGAPRDGAIGWTDASGNLWLFGGGGLGGYGTGDLWEYSPSSGQWTWMESSDDAIYGTKGTPSTNNFPGPRYGAVSWNDNSGNLWLFGGSYTITPICPCGTACPASVGIGYHNDLWSFHP